MPRLTVSRVASKWLIRIAAALIIVPAIIIALYGFLMPPLTPLMLIRLAQGEALDHRSVPLERISTNLVATVIAAEDNRFCLHYGFDTTALQAEINHWLDGGRPRGASTITQQTAKNILLWPGRDLLRKAIEAWLTPQIELLWSKRRILEVYLNVIEWGPGIYGAEAASRRFFGKSASDLSLREASLMAAVLPNPRVWSAENPSPYVQRRARRVLRRSETIGNYLTCVPHFQSASGMREAMSIAQRHHGF